MKQHFVLLGQHYQNDNRRWQRHGETGTLTLLLRIQNSDVTVKYHLTVLQKVKESYPMTQQLHS